MHHRVHQHFARSWSTMHHTRATTRTSKIERMSQYDVVVMKRRIDLAADWREIMPRALGCAVVAASPVHQRYAPPGCYHRAICLDFQYRGWPTVSTGVSVFHHCLL